MYCKKCGSLLPDDAKMCPNCSAPVEKTFEQAPVYEATKKKKILPIVMTTIVALVAIVGVLVYFMLPDISMMLNPEKQAKTALKNTTSSVKQLILESTSSDKLAKITSGTNTQVDYSLKVDSAKVLNVDYLTYVKVDTANVSMQVNPSAKSVMCSVGVSKGSDQNVISVLYYMDRDNINIKVPALFSETFTFKTSEMLKYSNVSYDTLFSTLSSSNTNLASYAVIIEAVTNDVFSALDTLIDNAEYSNLGKEIVETADMSEKMNHFQVTVSEYQVRDFVKEAVNKMYADDKLKAVIALSGMGTDPSSIISEIDSESLEFSKLSFDIFVNKKREVAKLNLNSDNVIGVRNLEKFDCTVVFKGKENLFDSTSIKLDLPYTQLSANIVKNGNNYIDEFNAEYKNRDGSTGYATVKYDFTKEEKDKEISVKINSMAFRINTKGIDCNVSLSGNAVVKEGAQDILNKNEFSNPIDVNKINMSQTMQLYSEFYKNMTVLKNIVSDELYNMVTKQLLGSIY